MNLEENIRSNNESFERFLSEVGKEIEEKGGVKGGEKFEKVKSRELEYIKEEFKKKYEFKTPVKELDQVDIAQQSLPEKNETRIVKEVVRMTVIKGVTSVIKNMQKYKNPYLMDLFPDTVKQKMIEYSIVNSGKIKFS